jgi:hypothetical protein
MKHMLAHTKRKLPGVVRKPRAMQNEKTTGP